MKAIVFGGSGFLGSYVADVLSEKGYEVSIFDVAPSPYLKTGQKMIVGDILDIDAVQKAVKGISIAYNFAGIADINAASEKPLETIKYNILGNAHILECLKHQKPYRYVFASTIYVYSEAGSFYKSSKQACELYIEDYSRKYGIPYTILRYGSLYGPRASETNPIFNLLKQALVEKKISHYGSGEEIREYIHVEDAARCSVEILSDNFVNQNVLITGHHPIKSRELVTMINEILGGNLAVEFRSEKPDAHYTVTPYSFNPRLGKKYISHYYIDMGQGLLQCIEEMHKSMHERKKRDRE